MFLINKSIINTSEIQTVASKIQVLYPELYSFQRKILSGSGEKYSQIEYSFEVKIVQNKSPYELNQWICCKRTTGIGLFPGGSSAMHYGPILRQDTKKDMLKFLNDGFVSYKHAAFHFTICLLLDWSHANQLWIIVSFLSTGLSF